MEEYPFMQFFKAGIPLSVNTDNRTVSRTTCTAEAALLQRTYELSPEDFAKIYRDSVEMSFASDDVKHMLLKKI
jgi:adenosine deaminase